MDGSTRNIRPIQETAYWTGSTSQPGHVKFTCCFVESIDNWCYLMCVYNDRKFQTNSGGVKEIELPGDGCSKVG